MLAVPARPEKGTRVTLEDSHKREDEAPDECECDSNTEDMSPRLMAEES